MCCWSELNKERAEWVSVLGSPNKMEMFAFDVDVYVLLLVIGRCSLWVTVCMVSRCKAFHRLLCSTVSKTFLKPMAATQSGWCHSVSGATRRLSV